MTMALDLKVFDPSRVLSNEPVVVIERKTGLVGPNLAAYQDQYQFRYTVHRQNTGFYTPVVFDVYFEYVEVNGDTDKMTQKTLKDIAEAFVEGALFMNHASNFIVDMLKGQEAGYNRKTVLENIRKEVEGTNKMWYSDWIVPPPTREGNRIVVYDLDHFGSMLDPVNTINQVARLVDERLNRVGKNSITYAKIVSGYTVKTV